MEFQLISPQTFVEAIKFNYDDLHNWITEQTEKYNNLVYTDDNIKEAKEDRAKLNRFRDNLDNARKDVKKQYLEPYNVFESDVKKLLAIIDEPLNAIDKHVKDYEEKKKADKKAQIEEYFNLYAGDLKQFLTLDKIFNQKWLNASVSIKSVKEEINNILLKINEDFKTIKDLKSEWEVNLIDKYFETLDIGAALREQKRLETLKEQVELENQGFTLPDEPIDWEKEKGNPSSPYAVIPDYAQKDQSTQAGDMAAEPTPEENSAVQEPVKIYTRKFWVTGTKEQLLALGQYLKDNGIEYGGIQ